MKALKLTFVSYLLCGAMVLRRRFYSGQSARETDYESISIATDSQGNQYHWCV